MKRNKREENCSMLSRALALSLRRVLIVGRSCVQLAGAVSCWAPWQTLTSASPTHKQPKARPLAEGTGGSRSSSRGGPAWPRAAVGHHVEGGCAGEGGGGAGQGRHQGSVEGGCREYERQAAPRRLELAAGAPADFRHRPPFACCCCGSALVSSLPARRMIHPRRAGMQEW